MTTRAKNRPKRIPVSGRRDILTVEGKDPNFKYTWVNDDRGMVQKYLNGGYEFVQDDVTVGQRDVDSGKGTSATVSRDVGHGIIAYLMRIPMEWYEEDLKERTERIKNSENDIRRTLDSGNYGKVEIN